MHEDTDHRGNPTVRGEAGSRRETPRITDPPEDLGRQDATDAEQVRESTLCVLDRRGDLLVDARHGGVEPSHLAAVPQAASAVLTASAWSVVRPWPLESSRTRAESLAGTSTTCSPALSSHCVRALPRPAVVSTAHRRCGHLAAQRRSWR